MIPPTHQLDEAPTIALGLPKTLEEYLANPPDGMEWVDDRLVEKRPLIWNAQQYQEIPTMTAKTRRIQSRLSRYWGNYMLETQLGGEVYVEASCQTEGRARVPDVAYLTPDLLAEVGEFNTFPHSFPLVAEVISPTDLAGQVFWKVDEYLRSRAQEVWLLFPDNPMIVVFTAAQTVRYGAGAIAQTLQVLPGFSVAIDALMA